MGTASASVGCSSLAGCGGYCEPGLFCGSVAGNAKFDVVLGGGGGRGELTRGLGELGSFAGFGRTIGGVLEVGGSGFGGFEIGFKGRAIAEARLGGSGGLCGLDGVPDSSGDLELAEGGQNAKKTEIIPCNPSRCSSIVNSKQG